ncbi:hypothetical protein HRI_005224000 [Hibiscus trionum]|uniref:Reverse transcriptase domain-containing protein n=1 Tax=Hibiscus trionum TaxID=183268 RepID=A0A9W7MRT4_HIBTR|nr:hypothetical protein HRI_005224000 [Hibiscus trionum]
MDWNAISWNIRGLGRPEKASAVRRLFLQKKPKLFFLQETKLQAFSISLYRRLGVKHDFDRVFSPFEGSVGGLLCVWDKDFLTIANSFVDRRFIALFGLIKGSQEPYGFINVYAPYVESEKLSFFTDLKSFMDNYQVNWIIGGDFNAYLSSEEKFGSTVNRSTIEVFRNFIQESQLVDLPLSGGSFTWSNNRDPPTFIRLDRFLVGVKVLSDFPLLCQLLLPKSISDHNPIGLEVVSNVGGPRPFKLYNYLMEESGFSDLVEAAFSKANIRKGKVGLQRILRDLKGDIKTWSKDKQDVGNKLIQRLEGQIAEEELKQQQGMVSSNIGELRQALWASMRKAVSIWLQNSRLKWFSDGDRNSHYFHLVASNRRRSNRIKSVEVDGRTFLDQQSISKCFQDFFSNVYRAKNTIEVDSFQLGFKKLSSAQQSNLEMAFTSEEVWAAISDMDSSRATDPDGYNMAFYKKFWPVIKSNLMAVFEDLFADRDWAPGLNHAFITLIPKKLGPACPDDYRPISLVGSIYKIISKVLSRRLRQCIDSVVSKAQFAFIPGRSILECSLIANEGIDYIRKMGLRGSLFKIDFKRAYDSVDWAFLIRVMKEMGFGNLWCRWIYRCISTASISVLINGSPTQSFQMARGLRQGCPLSPLLFNLIGEALHLMLEKATLSGLFKGFLIGRGDNTYNLSHLQYADDLLIFCSAALGEILNVKRVLRVFEISAGLQLNMSKCRLFGVNVEDGLISVWANKMGCLSATLPSDYLGLPLGPSRNSETLWEPVIEKFYKALATWKNKHLSYSGRLVLIKSVLSALPTHFLSIFKMPASVAVKLNRLMANFLWGDSESHRSIHWRKWTDLCNPLDCGGLGIHNLNLQNQALLMKWVWNFANSRDSEWRKLICCKLNWDPNCLIFGDTKHKLNSWIWKGIANAIYLKGDSSSLVDDQLALHVGDGKSIFFGSDFWVGDAPLQVNFPRIFTLATNKSGKIAEFGTVQDSKWAWNIPLRRVPFGWEIDQMNKFMDCLNSFKYEGLERDCFTWKGTGDGIFTVKSCYKILNRQSSFNPIWKESVWLGLAPPRAEFFLWQATCNKIPVRALLIHRGMQQDFDICCPLCKSSAETTAHLFLHCKYTWSLWQHLASYWNLAFTMPADIPSMLLMWKDLSLLRNSNSIWMFIPASTLWSIWLYRNEIVFHNKLFDPCNLIFITRFRIVSWFKSRNPDCQVCFDDLMSNLACPIPQKSSLKGQKVTCSWKPPPRGFLKFNVDAAMPTKGDSGGIGGVLRNHSGNVLFSFSEAINHCPVILGELLAIKAGLQKLPSMEEYGNHRIIIESDSALAIEWIKFPLRCPEVFRGLVNEITTIGYSTNCMFRSIPRVCNLVADSLAKEGIG